MTLKSINLLKALLFLTLLSAIACTGGQEKGEGKNVDQAEEVQLIPEGFQVMATDTLSTEGKNFVINILQQVDEDSLKSEMEEVPRPLMILEKRGEGYDIMARNDNVVMCGICGGIMGDPFDGLEAGENGFTILYFGGSRYRWTRETSFNYDGEKAEWILTGDSGKGFDSLDPESEPEVTEYTPAAAIGVTSFANFNVNNY